MKANALPSLCLRAGLAVVFAYAAIASLKTPNDWIGYLPSFTTKLVDPSLALQLLSIFQLVLAAWLLIGWQTRIAAAVCVLMLGGIVVSNFSLLAITFRDLGLMFAALALMSLESKL